MLFNPGILGINARNLLYIKPYNQKKAIMLADDKLKTKAFLQARGIPVPKLYGAIASKEELTKFDFKKLPSSFVIKPNLGYGGSGIIPIVQRRADKWITIDGHTLNEKNFEVHIQDILDGRYSISDMRDKAFFEHLIIAHEALAKFSYRGLPDIRVVVHNLIPVMAMLRLPTKESRGKANLHQGAIGTGIDIAKGEVTHILYRNKIIKEIPGSGSITGLKIPFWDDILMIASKAQLVTNLGYMAADVAIDKHYGPILLEINARAGLNVQIANLAPLRKRLERIEGLKVVTPEKGIRIAKDMFGRTVEKNVQHLTGKQIVAIEESVELIFKNGTRKVAAALNTGRERSVIDEKFALEHGLLDNPEEYDDEKSTLKLKFALAGKRIQTIVDVEKVTRKNFKMIIGQRDLTKDFLIDPNLKREHKLEEQKVYSGKVDFDPKVVDQRLIEIESKIKLLYSLRPMNLREEKAKFFKDFSYNPQFIYSKLQYDVEDLKRRLAQIYFDDSVLGQLFLEKSKEIQNKLELLQNRETELFTDSSIKLFGKPSSELMKEAEVILDKKIVFEDEAENVTAEKAKIIFEEALKSYQLQHWKVQLKEELVTNCIAGKNNTFFVKKGAKFSEKRVKNLIIHEIETHILTAENGKHQPLEMFNRGFAHYLTTQEGLAMYNVKQYGFEADSDRFYAAALVKATELAFTHSFADVFLRMLHYGLPQEKAFRVTLKLKRGLSDTAQKGAFTKDYLYFKGQKQIEQFVQSGGAIVDLYIGKFNLQDLALIKKIPELKLPFLLPYWLKK